MDNSMNVIPPHLGHHAYMCPTCGVKQVLFTDGDPKHNFRCPFCQAYKVFVKVLK